MHSEFKQKWGEQMSQFLVTKNGPGTRPATGPDVYFYCRSKVGEEHKETCVCICRKATIQYTITMEEMVPAHWTEHDVEFNRNDGSGCSDGLITAMELFREKRGRCLCDCVEATCLELHEGRVLLP